MNETPSVQTEDNTQPAPLGKASSQRPEFAKDFPNSTAVDTLLDAFEKGNYAFVRSESEKILATAEDPEEKKAAAEMLARLRPDPLAIKLLLGAISLLVVLTIWTYASHHH